MSTSCACVRASHPTHCAHRDKLPAAADGCATATHTHTRSHAPSLRPRRTRRAGRPAAPPPPAGRPSPPGSGRKERGRSGVLGGFRGRDCPTRPGGTGACATGSAAHTRGPVATGMADVGSKVPVDTRRLDLSKQTVDEAYATPDNFLEIDVTDPRTHGYGRGRYTDYLLSVRVRLRTLCRAAMPATLTGASCARGRRTCLSSGSPTRACAAATRTLSG